MWRSVLVPIFVIGFTVMGILVAAVLQVRSVREGGAEEVLHRTVAVARSVELPDGGEVLCVFASGVGTSVSCDWEGAK